MSKKRSTSVIAVILLVIILTVVYFYNPSPKKTGNVSTSTQTATSPKPTSKIFYKNTDYGFLFSLPDGWKDYTIIEDEWDGDSLDSSGQNQTTEHGPLISIRHPDWDYKAPRQDIPVMVFTLKQWSDMQADKFHIGAAPIGPSEIGRNKKHVFAIPARYNFAYLTGYEEVDQIIHGDNFQTF